MFFVVVVALLKISNCNTYVSLFSVDCNKNLLNVAAYWKSSNTKACAKKLSQILQTTFIMVEGDWSQSLCEVLSKKINERGLRKTWQFFELKHTILDA